MSFSVDTIKTDSVQVFNSTCDSPTCVIMETIKDDWQSGLEGSARQQSINGNSGILTMIVIIFVIISINFKECRKLFYRFSKELINDKRRENAFDEHSNHQSRLIVLTILQYIMYAGILLCGVRGKISGELDSSMDSFTVVMKCIGLYGIYYLFNIISYSTVAFTFAGKECSTKILKIFNSLQSLSGIALMIPALIALFYPHTATGMCIVGFIVYLSARLIFIIKCFRIFYINIFSLVYFILYLCALEIIPLISLVKLALLIR